MTRQRDWPGRPARMGQRLDAGGGRPGTGRRVGRRGRRRLRWRSERRSGRPGLLSRVSERFRRRGRGRGQNPDQHGSDLHAQLHHQPHHRHQRLFHGLRHGSGPSLKRQRRSPAAIARRCACGRGGRRGAVFRRRGRFRLCLQRPGATRRLRPAGPSEPGCRGC